MKKIIKKLFVFLTLPVVFSNSLPFLEAQIKKREENPEAVHEQHPIINIKNIVVSSINSTASAVTDVFENLFKK